MEATEVPGVDPDSLGVVEKHKDLDDYVPNRNSKENYVKVSPNNYFCYTEADFLDEVRVTPGTAAQH